MIRRYSRGLFQQDRSKADIRYHLAMSALPPKADLPILELLPPPAFRERRHRGLARLRQSLLAKDHSRSARRRALTDGVFGSTESQIWR